MRWTCFWLLKDHVNVPCGIWGKWKCFCGIVSATLCEGTFLVVRQSTHSDGAELFWWYSSWLLIEWLLISLNIVRKSYWCVIPCIMHSKCRDPNDSGLNTCVRYCHCQGRRPNLPQTSSYYSRAIWIKSLPCPFFVKIYLYYLAIITLAH